MELDTKIPIWVQCRSPIQRQGLQYLRVGKEHLGKSEHAASSTRYSDGERALPQLRRLCPLYIGNNERIRRMTDTVVATTTTDRTVADDETISGVTGNHRSGPKGRETENALGVAVETEATIGTNAMVTEDEMRPKDRGDLKDLGTRLTRATTPMKTEASNQYRRSSETNCAQICVPWMDATIKLTRQPSSHTSSNQTMWARITKPTWPRVCHV